MSSCLTFQQLDNLVTGRSADEAARHHLEGCAKCRRRAERIRAENRLVDEVRQLDPLGPGAPAIEGFEIQDEIHRGGQAVVYRAIQQSTKRRVAIKVMREGPFASRGDRARFEREVEILGRLNHPNIVAILDSGTAAGCFYYVMDYISGQPLDKYIADGRRPIDETLRLFYKICAAVHAAHLQGVIHRDLKPGNIRIDDNGEPHILDFGVAKVLTGEVSEVTGQFIGSLPWASPEQATFSPQSIDLRTDVYQLGVIAYQMLTGRFPYPVDGSIRDVLDHIIHSAAAAPRTYRRQVNDEIETIVLKCLAKERERRYQSAGELARDITRYLAGEPIEAKRDSGWYVLRKTLRRYRVPVTVAVTFSVFLAAFGAWMYVLYGRASVAERRAAQVTVLLQEMLAPIDSPLALSGEIQVREWLDDIADKAETTLADQPVARAVVRDTIGRAYLRLGLYDRAELYLRLALLTRLQLYGDGSLEVATSMKHVAFLMWARREYASAEKQFVEVLDLHRRLLGDEHPEVAKIVHAFGRLLHEEGQYGAADQQYHQALGLLRKAFGSEDPEVALCQNSIATLLCDQGQYEAAEALARQALEMLRRLRGRDDPDVVVCLHTRARAQQGGDALAPAEATYREALKLARGLFGDRHPSVAKLENDLASLLRDRGQVSEALALNEEALRVATALLDEAHPQVALVMRDKAALLLAQSGAGQAEPLARAALERLRSTLPPLHPDIATACFVLAQALLGRAATGEAEPLLRECLRIRRNTLPARHGAIAEAESVLGGCLTTLGRYAEAETLVRDGYAHAVEALGPRRAPALAALDRIVQLYDVWGKPEEAARYRILRPTTEPAQTGTSPP